MYDPNKPLYYIRMYRDGKWYFLYKLVHDKRSGNMKPIWWPENNRGDSVPHLYKLLTKARNAIDRFDMSLAIDCEVKAWYGGDGLL